MARPIWTNHALERLSSRGISQKQAEKTFYVPDVIEEGNNHTTVYKKTENKQTITLVLKQNEKREWLILSVWIDPPVPGTKDAKEKALYKAYKKASFWGKFLLLLKRQVGL